MVTSLGGEPDDVEQGIFSYTITLANNTGSRFTITGIEPVLSESVASRLSGQTYDSISVANRTTGIRHSFQARCGLISKD
jgi:hypothetical protein